MIHAKYRDPIKVVSIFDGTKIQPRTFEWDNKRYRVNKILNAHSTFDGRERVHFFSVANDTEYFKLELGTENLQWYLVEHYQE